MPYILVFCILMVNTGEFFLHDDSWLAFLHTVTTVANKSHSEEMVVIRLAFNSGGKCG
jgi:hypothetical protein